MIYYYYDPKTFEYIGSMPGSGNPDAMPPFNSTTDAPKAPENHAAFRNIETGEWEYVEDYRGRMAYAKDLSGSVIVDSVGGIPETHTLEEPPPKKDGFVVEFKRKYWGYTEDHRGEVGYVNGERVEITETGEFPEGWTTESPTIEDTRTNEEKRQEAYLMEADPIARMIEGYRLEGDAFELAGDTESANVCETKANALLADFLQVKKDIRARFPEHVVALKKKK